MKFFLRNMAGNEVECEMIGGGPETINDVIGDYIDEIITPIYFNKFGEALKDLFNDELDKIDEIGETVT